MRKTNKNIGSKNSRIWIAGIFVITLFGGYLYKQGSSPLNALANAPSPAEIEQGKNFSHKIVPPAMGLKGLVKTLNHLTVACWTGVDTLPLH